MSVTPLQAASNGPRIVLYISGTGDLVGGGQVSLLQLVFHLDRERYSPVVLTSGAGSLTHKLDEAEVEVVHETGLGARYLRGNYIRVLRTSRRLARLIRSRRIALLHNNSWVPGDRVAGIAASRILTRTPYVHHERDTWTPNRKADKLTARFATRVVSISDAVSMKYRELGAASKISKIYNGVDLERFGPQLDAALAGGASDLRNEVGASNAAPLIGMFSRMGREKGHPLLIRAAAAVLSEFPNAHFIIVGSTVNDADGYAASLRTLAGEHGIGSSIHFLGFRDDVPELMRQCSFTVCPSTHVEPFGRVVIESMACERPVIAAACGGPLEIIEHETTGVLVEPNDVEQWAAAMTSLLRDPDRTQTMGVAARKVVAERFGIKDHADRMQALYDRLLTD